MVSWHSQWFSQWRVDNQMVSFDRLTALKCIALYNFTCCGTKKVHPHTVVMYVKSSKENKTMFFPGRMYVYLYCKVEHFNMGVIEDFLCFGANT